MSAARTCYRFEQVAGLRWWIASLVVVGAFGCCAADTPQKQPTLKGHEDIVWCVAWAPDGKTLASGSVDGTVRLWDPISTKELAKFDAELGEVVSVTFAPDGKTLASSHEDGSIILWDIATGKKATVLKGHTNTVHCVAFAPNGKSLASGSEDETVRVWNLETGKEKFVLKEHLDEVWCVTFAPNGEMLASGSGDGTIRIWDTTTGKMRAVMKGHAGDVYSVAFSPDGKTLASASEDETVRLWDAATGKESAVLNVDQGWVFSVAYSTDGKLLASGGGDGTIRLWDPSTATGLAALKGHSGEIYSVAFVPNGTMLASASRDTTLKLWETPKNREAIALGKKLDYSAVNPVPRKDYTWLERQAAMRERDKPEDVDVVFLGDSITEGWEDTGKDVWKSALAPLKSANFGINGDRTQHVLWRLRTGKELQQLRPKVIVLLIGTNNLGSNSAGEIVEGITAIVTELHKQHAQTPVLVMGLFPRRPDAANPVRNKIQDINKQIAKLDNGKDTRFLDIGQQLLETDGTLSKEIMFDYLHLTEKGYQIWADAVRPMLEDLLKKGNNR